MINREEEELIEGVNLIIENEPDFKKYCKNNHYLDKIEDALSSVGLSEFKRIVVEMVLFDCLIGNTDRHSENWALIRNKVGENIHCRLKQQGFVSRLRFYWQFHKDFDISLFRIHRLLNILRHRFAPFYDNGSSLGRELTEERIQMMLDNQDAFDKFFVKGTSDIIIREEKKSFLETIDLIVSYYQEECGHFVKRHLSLYNKTDFEALINNMDAEFPKTGFDAFRISNKRKQFIVKLVDARINYIFQSIDNFKRYNIYGI